MGGREFEVLKELRDRFVGRLLGERKGPGEARTPLHKKNGLIISHTNDPPAPVKDDTASDYEPTWMFETRDSLFWAWRRVKEFTKDWFGVAGGYEEALALMRS
ncbi:MAG: hypothetical protein HY592_01955 [Candidatus Omnitrophica bacterium]|nr:hypothetical protein [Candidatus Omnitrophota bacterium]